MYIKEAFIYCPRCGQKFSEKSDRLLTCGFCGLHFYINPKACTSIAIFNDRGEILLVERGIEPNKGKWDLPGGFIEQDETIIESAVREAKEELSVDIEIIQILQGLPDEYNYRGILYPTLGLILSARIISGSLSPKDDVAVCEFVEPNKALKRDLAFPHVKNGITLAVEHYSLAATSRPSLTA